MDELVVDRSGGDGVVTLTLNRPRVKNAIAPHMWEELARIFREVADRESDRVLIVTGAGEAFCAGADLGEVSGKPAHPLVAMLPVNQAALAHHERASRGA